MRVSCYPKNIAIGLMLLVALGVAMNIATDVARGVATGAAAIVVATIVDVMFTVNPALWRGHRNSPR